MGLQPSKMVAFFGGTKTLSVLLLFSAVQKLRKRDLSPALAATAFVGVYHLTRNVGNKLQRSDNEIIEFVRSVLPGAYAALSACAIEPSIASSLWITWLWVRVARVYVSINIPHLDVIAGCFAAGYNLSTYLWNMHELLPAYTAFLAQCGGSNGLGLKQMELIHHKRKDIVDPNRLQRFCHIIHPDSSCPSLTRNAFLQGLRMGVYVQVPLHVMAFASSSRRDIWKSLWNLARSVLFLGVYPASAFAIMCSWWNITGRTSETRAALVVLGSLVGLSLFIESTERRKEIAAFTFTHALVAIWRRNVGLAQLKSRNSNIASILFAVATGLLFRVKGAVPRFIRWAVDTEEDEQQQGKINNNKKTN